MAITTGLETLIPALCGRQSDPAGRDADAPHGGSAGLDTGSTGPDSATRHGGTGRSSAAECDSDATRDAAELAAGREFAARLGALSDEQLLVVKDQMLAVNRRWAAMMQSMTGIVAARSSREFGHGGLAAKRGHRSAVSMVQEDLGISKAEATRLVSVAESVTEVTGAAARPDGATTEAEREAQAVAEAEARAKAEAEAKARGESGEDADLDDEVDETLLPWDDALKVANRSGVLSGSQFNAITAGLGDPPQIKHDINGDPVNDDFTPLIGDDGAAVTRDDADAFDLQTREAWRQAAVDLIAEAQVRMLSDLQAHARSVRDVLDPEGAERRFTQRHDARAFQIRQLDTGAMRATWIMDDITGLAVKTAIDAALRPRTGGPRFVDSAEDAAAKELANDPRTTEQLAHDLMADIFRAGILADAKTVFGTRQAGVRLVQVVTDDGQRADVAHAEDGLGTLPGTIADQHLCDVGATRILVDGDGNPLNLGRTSRVFTAKQRMALAARDGGCRWTGCERPASYCEAHHIDPWEEGGHTDIDRGILLCQYHHLTLHNNHWRITREGTGDFILTHADHPPQILPPRMPLTYAWHHLTLPDRQLRPNRTNARTSSPPSGSRTPRPTRNTPAPRGTGPSGTSSSGTVRPGVGTPSAGRPGSGSSGGRSRANTASNPPNSDRRPPSPPSTSPATAPPSRPARHDSARRRGYITLPSNAYPIRQ